MESVGQWWGTSIQNVQGKVNVQCEVEEGRVNGYNGYNMTLSMEKRQEQKEFDNERKGDKTHRLRII